MGNTETVEVQVKLSGDIPTDFMTLATEAITDQDRSIRGLKAETKEALVVAYIAVAFGSVSLGMLITGIFIGWVN